MSAKSFGIEQHFCQPIQMMEELDDIVDKALVGLGYAGQVIDATLSFLPMYKALKAGITTFVSIFAGIAGIDVIKPFKSFFSCLIKRNLVARMRSKYLQETASFVGDDSVKAAMKSGIDLSEDANGILDYYWLFGLAHFEEDDGSMTKGGCKFPFLCRVAYSIRFCALPDLFEQFADSWAEETQTTETPGKKPSLLKRTVGRVFPMAEEEVGPASQTSSKNVCDAKRFSFGGRVM